MSLLLGIILGTIAMFCFGIANAISKTPAQSIGPKKLVFYRGLVSCGMLFIVILFSFNKISFSLNYIFLAIGISLLGYLPLALFYQGLRHGKVGIVVPIANSSSLVTVLLAFLFLNEKLAGFQYIALLLVFGGILFLSIKIEDVKKSDIFSLKSGVPFALLAMVLWGTVFFLFRIPALIIGPLFTSFIIEGGTVVGSSLHLVSTKEKNWQISSEMLKFVVVLGLLGAIGSTALIWGMTFSSVSIVAAFMAAAPLISLLFSHYVYQERLEKRQYIAIFFTLIGLIGLAFFS